MLFRRHDFYGMKIILDSRFFFGTENNVNTYIFENLDIMISHICLESNLVNFEIPKGLITVLGSSFNLFIPKQVWDRTFS